MPVLPKPCLQCTAITPDSFSDGGKYFEAKLNLAKVVEDAVQMEKDGADFIDVGGESTRPGSENISIGEELDRVIPVISELKSKISLPVSIDTYKSEVAEEIRRMPDFVVQNKTGEVFFVEVKFRANETFKFKDLPKDYPYYNAFIILVSK